MRWHGRGDCEHFHYVCVQRGVSVITGTKLTILALTGDEIDAVHQAPRYHHFVLNYVYIRAEMC